VKIIHNPKTADLNDLRNITHKWVLYNHERRSREWAYQSIEPKLFVENMLGDGDRALLDYKFFVFDGRVEFIQIDLDRMTDHTRLILDRNWEDTRIQLCYPRPAVVNFSAPAAATDMVGIAEKIGGGFSFARVDLYETDNQIKFGEITFYPGAGLEVFSNGGDELFGSFWKLEHRMF
jgi:hypothetical protein